MWLAYSDEMAKPRSKDPIERESTRLTCVATMCGQTTNEREFWKEMITGLMGSEIKKEGLLRTHPEKVRMATWGSKTLDKDN